MKTLVVYKKSNFELYSNSPDADTRAYANADSADAIAMRKSHARQNTSLENVLRDLDKNNISHDDFYRADLEKLNGNQYDLVIAVGGDGTFLEVSHYIQNTPLLGVNSDPTSSHGFYCAATDETFERYIAEETPQVRVNRLRLLIDGSATKELVLNEIFVADANPAAASNYTIICDNGEERIKSSGLVAATAAGSSGWMAQLGGEITSLDSTLIQYHNRDRKGDGFEFTQNLQLISRIRNGIISVDGPHVQYPITLGSTVELRRGEPLTMIGEYESRR